MIKRIGIITFHGFNYGAILQCYALQQVLCEMGYITENIQYTPSSEKLMYPIKIKVQKQLRSVVFSLIYKERIKKNISFHAQYLSTSGIKYLGKEDIMTNPPLYDAYITGSDQVWNPKITNGDEIYFLSFVPNEKKKIAYAASFGVREIDNQYNQLYCKLLNEIDYLSVREETGKSIVKKLTGRDSEIVLDPTLLLDKLKWLKISSSSGYRCPFIFCYHMARNKNVSRFIYRNSRILGKKRNLDVVHLGEKEYLKLFFWRKNNYSAGPSDFIEMFKYSKYVFTNSFHGVVFAIIFNVNFYFITDSTDLRENSLAGRVQSLLHNLSLENRIIDCSKTKNIPSFEKINFAEVESLLYKLQVQSKKFLINSLGGFNYI